MKWTKRELINLINLKFITPPPELFWPHNLCYNSYTNLNKEAQYLHINDLISFNFVYSFHTIKI